MFRGLPTPLHRAVIPLYEVALIVAGSRNFNDYEFFSKSLESYLLEHHKGKTLIFISGRAWKGADAMIIKWCKLNGYPWVEFPADWEKFGRSAGYVRNTEMAKVGKNLLSFWDGMSKGTEHMVKIATRLGLEIHTVLVDPDNKEDDHGW